MIGPYFEELALKFPDVVFVKVDVDELDDVAAACGISAMPTFQLYLTGLGVKESGVGGLIRAAYDLLGLRTYLTTGPKETRAWTIHAGDRAPQAAGVIHTDFERGFIAAETVAYADLQSAGTMVKVKEAGKLRVEGKEYVVQDGDVMDFRFNV